MVLENSVCVCGGGVIHEIKILTRMQEKIQLKMGSRIM